MGWSLDDSDPERPIGYSVKATCDIEDCQTQIDRGVAYACGGFHGAGEGMVWGDPLPGHKEGNVDNVWTCENYVCSEHQSVIQLSNGQTVNLCSECLDYHQSQTERKDEK